MKIFNKIFQKYYIMAILSNLQGMYLSELDIMGINNMLDNRDLGTNYNGQVMEDQETKELNYLKSEFKELMEEMDEISNKITEEMKVSKTIYFAI